MNKKIVFFIGFNIVFCYFYVLFSEFLYNPHLLPRLESSQLFKLLIKIPGMWIMGMSFAPDILAKIFMDIGFSVYWILPISLGFYACIISLLIMLVVTVRNKWTALSAKQKMLLCLVFMCGLHIIALDSFQIVVGTSAAILG